ncbi:endonuclease/exonuclease/phosphatase family protein [Streptomyces endophyticus]|uniref:Endonuclease/exonuclease/phosphatase family protein n=1 Tax=Streptomyces endophyticus TaxID=714166 RepID=A0ABU6FG72_9ACTN|nr:endonuclease/exonuclease/phosphatase family protein [Streptomyces endophyticus]MEB8343056.1 endonuclease/exonuclease/phosphatase family protein [Streptomyces endophyticus]
MRPTSARPTPGRLRRRVSAVVGLVAASLAGVVVLAAVQTAGPTRSHAGSRTLTVATWNMCGVERWHCDGTGDRRAKRGEVVGLATARGARVVFLQEACASDVSAVRARLGRSWHSVFRPYSWRSKAGRTSTVRCGSGSRDAAGFAMLSAYPLSHVRTVASRQPTVGLRRGVVCASVAAHRLTVCNAHLSRPGDDLAHPRWELRDDQLKALTGAARGRRVVYGGDLNVDPPSGRNPVAWVWPSAPYGTQRECDQRSASARSGRATHVSGHKLDYLFTGLPRAGCTVRDTGDSDHYAVLLRVRTG